MNIQRMHALALALGEAKNRQDVDTAVALMHDDMVLHSPAWGVVARGKADNAAVLRRFFHDYPDYTVAFDAWASDGTNLIAWATVRMTMAPHAHAAQGLRPNGRRIEIPAAIRMTFRDGLIASEHFLCDLAQICAQSGVSVDAVQRNIFGACAA